MTHLVTQPPNLKKLYPHQLNAIGLMEEREKKTILNTNCPYSEDNTSIIKSKVGIFSDITGYGKTLAIIGLMMRNKLKFRKRFEKKSQEFMKNVDVILKKDFSSMTKEEMKILAEYSKYQRFNETGFERFTNFSNRYFIEETAEERARDEEQLVNTNLILLNNSLIGQWENELSYSDLNYESVKTRKFAGEIDPTEYDVILCTPTMLEILYDRFPRFKWKRFIVDEPQSLAKKVKNYIIAEFYWLITATPFEIGWSRRGCFLTKLLSSATGYIFNALVVKNDDAFVRSSFSLPPTETKTYECYQPIYNILRGFFSPEFGEMLAADDIKGVVEMLGGDSTDNIIDLVKQKLKDEIELLNARITIYTRQGNHRMKQSCITKKEQKESAIQNIDDRVRETFSNGNCGICMDDFDKPVLVGCCQNVFCGKCLLPWLSTNQTCPFCRETVEKEKLIYIEESGESEGGGESSSPEPEQLNKIQTIEKIIKEKPDGKFILFSSRDETFNKIQVDLVESGISFSELKGTSTRRENTLKKFKEGEISTIFLNAKYNGAGINLQETTDIILYHEMSEDMTTQILGRANRIGRTLPLTVHQLTS